MRTTDERVSAVQRRTLHLQKIRRLQLRNRALSVAACAASVIVLVGMGIAIPGIEERYSQAPIDLNGAAGSIFSATPGLGYVVIAVVAFLLGVCVSLLCIHLRRQSEEALRSAPNPEDEMEP